MKKCASCTKDLPDAALHCVFCGAKQPPAPAVAGSVAKTVMGHASSEMVEQLKAQAAAAAARQQAPSNLPAAAPYSAPKPGFSPTPGPAPAPAAVAPTMFVPGSGPGGGPAPGANPMSGPPIGGPMGGPMGGGPMGGPGPMGPGPMPGPGPMGPGPGPMGPGPMPGPPMPGPSAMPAGLPYAARQAQQQGRAAGGGGGDKFTNSLRMQMYIWGAALLVAFMTPFSLEPDLKFLFNVIIDGKGIDKLFPLLVVSIGVIAIVLALIPMATMMRGLFVGILGVAGILVPQLLWLTKGDLGLPQIMQLVATLGVLTLVPGLLVRAAYREAMLPRILVTVGALCVIVPQLIPQGGDIPLVANFEALIDAPAKLKINAIIGLGPVLLALLSLLAWLPAPSSGGATVFAWLLITWGAVALYTGLIVEGSIGAALEHSPYLSLVAWVPGFAELGILGSAYVALAGYGFAAVFGKQLE